MEGYSGVGKSSLVGGLVSKLWQELPSLPFLHTFGKYNVHYISADPFFAIAHAMS
jgi:hypothetical protein